MRRLRDEQLRWSMLYEKAGYCSHYVYCAAQSDSSGNPTIHQSIMLEPKLWGRRPGPEWCSDVVWHGLTSRSLAHGRSESVEFLLPFIACLFVGGAKSSWAADLFLSSILMKDGWDTAGVATVNIQTCKDARQMDMRPMKRWNSDCCRRGSSGGGLRQWVEMANYCCCEETWREGERSRRRKILETG